MWWMRCAALRAMNTHCASAGVIGRTASTRPAADDRTAKRRARLAFTMASPLVLPKEDTAFSARRDRALAGIVVETALDLAADPTRLDVFHEKRTRPVLGIGQPLVQHLHHRKASVEADEISELERSHRMIGAELHAGVDRLDIAHALVKRVD